MLFFLTPPIARAGGATGAMMSDGRCARGDLRSSTASLEEASWESRRPLQLLQAPRRSRPRGGLAGVPRDPIPITARRPRGDSWSVIRSPRGACVSLRNCTPMSLLWREWPGGARVGEPLSERALLVVFVSGRWSCGQSARSGKLAAVMIMEPPFLGRARLNVLLRPGMPAPRVADCTACGPAVVPAVPADGREGSPRGRTGRFGRCRCCFRLQNAGCRTSNATSFPRSSAPPAAPVAAALCDVAAVAAAVLQWRTRVGERAMP
mmetsp:Transcript_40380/g.101637  ORF Transcript_40380/g.101637 Transcript_40380/m.101637 type:complete len:264 (-) Transcript_40380:316-1107(-)